MPTNPPLSGSRARVGEVIAALGAPLPRAVGCALLLAVPSLRAVFKYLPHPTLAGLALAFLLVAWAVGLVAGARRGAGVARALNRGWLTWALAFACAVATFLVYPVADARRLVGAGSTADDAMIVTAKALLGPGGIYEVALYDGAPVSPGPGWIVLNAPFAWSGLYWCLGVTYMVVALAGYRRLSGATGATNMALLLLMAAPVFWELLLTGHDLVAVGFSFVIAVCLSFPVRSSGARGGLGLVLVAAAVGVISTSRVVFAVVPLLLALFMWRSSRRNASIFLTVSLLVCCGLHAAFGFSSADYPPLHVLDRAARHLSRPLATAGVVATVAVLVVMWRRLDDTVEGWMAALGATLWVPLATVAAGELLSVGGRFAAWEGANYLVPALPLILLAVLPQNQPSPSRPAEPGGCRSARDGLSAPVRFV